MRLWVLGILTCAMVGLAAACSDSDATAPSSEPREEPRVGTAASPPADGVVPTPTGLLSPTVRISTPTSAPRLVAKTGTSARSIDRGSGLAASDFELTLFDGQPFRLSDLGGTVVVLNFWASWCLPCRAEMPDFQEMWEELRDQEVVFLGIAVSDSERDARAFAEATGVTYLLGLDENGWITRGYRVTSLPTTFLIDRDGKESRRFGIANKGALRIFVETMLNDE
jgi:peroxiredoxin